MKLVNCYDWYITGKIRIKGQRDNGTMKLGTLSLVFLRFSYGSDW